MIIYHPARLGESSYTRQYSQEVISELYELERDRLLLLCQNIDFTTLSQPQLRDILTVALTIYVACDPSPSVTG